MAPITDSLIAAGVAASIGFAALSFSRRPEGELEEKMVVRLLLGPLCLAVVILAVNGVATRFSQMLLQP